MLQQNLKTANIAIGNVFALLEILRTLRSSRI